jgi:hypothetical protein
MGLPNSVRRVVNPRSIADPPTGVRNYRSRERLAKLFAGLTSLCIDTSAGVASSACVTSVPTPTLQRPSSARSGSGDSGRESATLKLFQPLAVPLLKKTVHSPGVA